MKGKIHVVEKTVLFIRCRLQLPKRAVELKTRKLAPSGEVVLSAVP